MSKSEMKPETLKALEATLEIGRSIMAKKQILEAQITAKNNAANQAVGETKLWLKGYCSGLQDGVKMLQSIFDEYS